MAEYDLVDGTAVRLSRHDKDFLHFLAKFDFESDIPRVKAYIAKTYPSVPLFDLCVDMDYVVSPLVKGAFAGISVTPASSYHWVDDEDKHEMERKIRKIKSLKTPHILARVQVREGKTVRTFSMIFNVPATT